MADRDDASEDDRDDGLRAAVELRKQRREAWEQSSERPLWRNLSMVGALGWLIVTPSADGSMRGSARASSGRKSACPGRMPNAPVSSSARK
jgi:hypothetical protein